jgi:hypothetical protein
MPEKSYTDIPLSRRSLLKKVAVASGAGVAAVVMQANANGQDFSNPSDPFSPLNPASPLYPNNGYDMGDDKIPLGWVAGAVVAAVATAAAAVYVGCRIGQGDDTDKNSKGGR